MKKTISESQLKSLIFKAAKRRLAEETDKEFQDYLNSLPKSNGEPMSSDEFMGDEKFPMGSDDGDYNKNMTSDEKYRHGIEATPNNAPEDDYESEEEYRTMRTKHPFRGSTPYAHDDIWGDTEEDPYEMDDEEYGVDYDNDETVDGNEEYDYAMNENKLRKIIRKSVKNALNEINGAPDYEDDYNDTPYEDEYDDEEETPISEAMNDLTSAIAALGSAEEDNMKLPNRRMNRFVIEGMHAAEEHIRKAIRALKQAENSYKNGEI